MTVTQTQLIKDFSYKGGKLYWLPRGNGKFDKQFAGKECGCVTSLGYRLLSYRGSNILAHVVVWVMHNGPIPNGYQIDHINNNGLDNDIKNLRICTSSQNAFNKRMRTNNKSGFKGVMWNKSNSNWRVRLAANKKSIEIGSFDSLEDAVSASNIARQKHHGDFFNHGMRSAA